MNMDPVCFDIGYRAGISTKMLRKNRGTNFMRHVDAGDCASTSGGPFAMPSQLKREVKQFQPRLSGHLPYVICKIVCHLADRKGPSLGAVADQYEIEFLRFAAVSGEVWR